MLYNRQGKPLVISVDDKRLSREVAIWKNLRSGKWSVGEVKMRLAQVASGLAGLAADLREISHGIHPAILWRGGLGPALKTLARRSAVAVKLDLEIQGQLPDFAQVTADCVASEALINAAKHAQASEVTLSAKTEDAVLHLSIRDDGNGGATAARDPDSSGSKTVSRRSGVDCRSRAFPRSGTSIFATIPLGDAQPSR